MKRGNYLPTLFWSYMWLLSHSCGCKTSGRRRGRWRHGQRERENAVRGAAGARVPGQFECGESGGQRSGEQPGLPGAEHDPVSEVLDLILIQCTPSEKLVSFFVSQIGHSVISSYFTDQSMISSVCHSVSLPV